MSQTSKSTERHNRQSDSLVEGTSGTSYQIIQLPKVMDPRGNLSFIQQGQSLPFEIERAYWIYDVPGGMARQGRALRATDELIVALSGSFDVVIDDGQGSVETIHLCRSYAGVLVPAMRWREIVNFSTNSVALVLASTTYSEEDYIRDYQEFVAERGLTSLGRTSDRVAGDGDPEPDDGTGRGRPSPQGVGGVTLECGMMTLARHLDPNGSLTEVENTGAFPFAIRRVFYLYDVPADTARGGHSHYRTHQMIVAVSGSFKVTLDDGHEKHTYTLDRPFQGLYIHPGVWDSLHDFSGGAVCLVLSSEKYDEADYCRDYALFKSLKDTSGDWTGRGRPSPQSVDGRHSLSGDWTGRGRPSPQSVDGRHSLSTNGHSLSTPVKRYRFLDLATANAPYMEEMRDAACRVIDSGWYIGGGEVERLEHTLCRLSATPHAIGVSNGLDALRLIFRAYIELGRLKPGDEVIVPANTYVASVLAVTDNDLVPVFVEPDPATLNLDSTRVEAALTDRTRAILPVHLYGRACWDERLAKIVRAHDLIVVEDNAQAIGATSPTPGLFGSYATGGLGHAAAFSFYPTKNIGAVGDAGAVTTHDDALAAAVAALRNYGSDRRYHNIYEGYNCRLDPIQAAMLNVKLSHIDEETDLRRALARIYTDNIRNPRVITPTADDLDRSVWHQYVVRIVDGTGRGRPSPQEIDERHSQSNARDDFRRYLAERGVETDIHYATPPHRQPCYSRYAGLSLPITDRLADEVVSLPISRCTSEADALAIARIINSWAG